jgi:xylulokinase
MEGFMLVAGVDSSTQSTKVVLCRAEDGRILDQRSAPHPGATECDPAAWWAALIQAGEGLLSQAAAVGVAGQQHGMIVLDRAGQVIRPALLWNDLRSAGATADLIKEHGGPQWWATHTGSVPTASFTVTKLRWLADHEPANAMRAQTVLLPHDWLTWKLRSSEGGGGGGAGGGIGEAVTDRGDASGTGYFSTADGTWLPDLAASAIGHAISIPEVAQPAEAVGETSWGAALSAGTGDNMAAALGLGLQSGDVAISIGTSGTVFAFSEVPAADPSGAVAGFADATGHFLPLVCTINAGLVLSAMASLLGAGLDELSSLALASTPGADGVTLLPYLDGERTPDRPNATGVLRGLTTQNATRENLARAGVESVLVSLASVGNLLTQHGVERQRVLLIGGAARSEAVRKLAPGIVGSPVVVPAPGEYVARGAARQAAWALAGTAEPPQWPAPSAEEYTGESHPEILQMHESLRDDTAAWAG